LLYLKVAKGTEKLNKNKKQMLDPQIILRVSDLEEAIKDYKAGLFSDREFVRELGNIVAKLYVATKEIVPVADEDLVEV